MLVRQILVSIFIGGSLLVDPALARHIMEPRVPLDKIEEARALVSPLPDSPDIVEKVIYEGKGTCFNCHGKNGRGDGPGGMSSIPLLGIFDTMGCGGIGRKVKSFG